MSTQQQNQPQRQQQQAPEWRGVTIYWYLGTEPDQGMARTHVEQRAARAGAAEAVMHAIDLRQDQVNDTTRVIILRRNHNADRDSVEYADRRTIVKSTHAPLTESAPLYGRDFWRAAVEGRPEFGGHLDHAAFVRAAGPLASPLTLHYRPDQLPGIVKLSMA